MSKQESIFAYENSNIPEVNREVPVKINKDRRPTVVGFIGRDVGRGPPNIGYVSERRRTGRKKHFFVKEAGYPLSEAVIDQCDRYGVTTVFIIEKETERALEFSLNDYRHGDRVEESGCDKQMCVPADSYRHVWDADEIRK